MQNLEERATSIEWMLLEIVARQDKIILRIGDTLIELSEVMAREINELKTKINELEGRVGSN